MLTFFFVIATILVALGHVTLRKHIAVGITRLIDRNTIHRKRQTNILVKKGFHSNNCQRLSPDKHVLTIFFVQQF